MAVPAFLTVRIRFTSTLTQLLGARLAGLPTETTAFGEGGFPYLEGRFAPFTFGTKRAMLNA